MEFGEKARIRLEHWIRHNDGHLGDYEAFAAELEEAGLAQSAGHVREMAALAKQSGDCLRRALESLEG